MNDESSGLIKYPMKHYIVYGSLRGWFHPACRHLFIESDGGREGDWGGESGGITLAVCFACGS